MAHGSTLALAAQEALAAMRRERDEERESLKKAAATYVVAQATELVVEHALEHRQEVARRLAERREHNAEVLEEVEAELEEFFEEQVEPSMVAEARNEQIDAVDRYSAWSLVHDAASGVEKFAAFKEAVLGDSVELGVSPEQQHAINVAQLESALADVKIDDRAPLEEQLAQYKELAAQSSRLDAKTSSASVLSPVAVLDSLIEKCNLVGQMLMGKQQQFASEFAGEVAAAGGAEGFVAEQAAGMVFFAQSKKGSMPSVESVPSIS